MSKDSDKSETESTYSGKFGERNRSTPGRTPRELGLDEEEAKGHSVVDGSPDFIGGASEVHAAKRRNPPLTEGVEKAGVGGLSTSGGVAGGARGNSGTSDAGAGGPDGESRGGPGEYKSTSRGDLVHGTVDSDRSSE